MISKWAFLTYLFLFFQSSLSLYIYDNVEIYGQSTGNNSVRGTPAYTGQFPFSVIFYEKEPRETNIYPMMSPICSGSIITSRWVLTTAIPLGNYPLYSYFMLAGIKTITQNSEDVLNYIHNIYHIDMLIIHPTWHVYDYNNLGLARTTRELPFGNELGSIRIPINFDVPNNNNTICTMNIWAINTVREHLMGHYQPSPISKQTLYFRVANGPEFCSDFVFTNKTLCVIQVNSDHRKDVCAVNSGAILQCNCSVVGLFTGINGELSCVDAPPLKYTAVNLVEHLKWLTMVTTANISKPYDFHAISSCCSIHLSCNVVFIYIPVIYKIITLKLKVE